MNSDIDEDQLPFWSMQDIADLFPLPECDHLERMDGKCIICEKYGYESNGEVMAGKGDSPRPVDKKKWEDNYERLFGRKGKKDGSKDQPR